MTRVVRFAALACAGVLVASAAFASVPSPSTSTVASTPTNANSQILELEGTTSGVADNCADVIGGLPSHCGRFTVTVRDASNNIIANSSVVIDFSACTDALISCDQNFSPTGTQGYAGSKKITGTTNAAGQFQFRPQGAENGRTILDAVPSPNTSPGAALGAKCATLYADGVPLRNLQIIGYDITGTDSPGSAVNGIDGGTEALEVVRENAPFNAPKLDRNDVDHNNAINGLDNSTFAQFVLQSLAPANTGTKDSKHSGYCP